MAALIDGIERAPVRQQAPKAALRDASFRHSFRDIGKPASLTNTVRYPAMSPEPFKDIWR
jgi:hypothetical protein